MSGAKEQGNLFDIRESLRLEEKAIETVRVGAPQGWLERARWCVLCVARRGKEFTSDDVWESGLNEPPEPRALGAVMRDLARQGVIARTGQYVKTARKTRHAAPIAVWKAL